MVVSAADVEMGRHSQFMQRFPPFFFFCGDELFLVVASHELSFRPAQLVSLFSFLILIA